MAGASCSHNAGCGCGNAATSDLSDLFDAPGAGGASPSQPGSSGLVSIAGRSIVTPPGGVDLKSSVMPARPVVPPPENKLPLNTQSIPPQPKAPELNASPRLQQVTSVAAAQPTAQVQPNPATQRLPDQTNAALNALREQQKVVTTPLAAQAALQRNQQDNTRQQAQAQSERTSLSARNPIANSLTQSEGSKRSETLATAAVTASATVASSPSTTSTTSSSSPSRTEGGANPQVTATQAPLEQRTNGTSYNGNYNSTVNGTSIGATPHPAFANAKEVFTTPPPTNSVNNNGASSWSSPSSYAASSSAMFGATTNYQTTGSSNSWSTAPAPSSQSGASQSWGNTPSQSQSTSYAQSSRASEGTQYTRVTRNSPAPASAGSTYARGGSSPKVENSRSVPTQVSRSADSRITPQLDPKQQLAIKSLVESLTPQQRAVLRTQLKPERVRDSKVESRQAKALQPSPEVQRAHHTRSVSAVRSAPQAITREQQKLQSRVDTVLKKLDLIRKTISMIPKSERSTLGRSLRAEERRFESRLARRLSDLLTYLKNIQSQKRVIKKMKRPGELIKLQKQRNKLERKEVPTQISIEEHEENLLYELALGRGRIEDHKIANEEQ